MHQRQLVHMSAERSQWNNQDAEQAEYLTGGFSSDCSPRSGLADRFANTPSVGLDADEGIGMGRKAGNSVTRLSTVAWDVVGVGSDWLNLEVGGSALINRCRSSPSFSASEASPSSKASSKSLSVLFSKGSCPNRRRDVGDEALERKEGGGE